MICTKADLTGTTDVAAAADATATAADVAAAADVAEAAVAVAVAADDDGKQQGVVEQQQGVAEQQQGVVEQQHQQQQNSHIECMKESTVLTAHTRCFASGIQRLDPSA